jgi:inositol polyphosphate 5-phosphatase INPP5B/F
MVDLTVTNVALGAQSKKASQQWVQLLDQALNDNNPAIALRNPDDRYECIGTRYLVGVNIAVYVRSRYRAFVSEVQDAEAPVGVMGVMGNKGGVSLRLKIFDTTMCFVCAHLAAHRGAVAQRNADFASIMAKTEFRDEAKAEAGSAAAARGVGGAADLGKISILDHEHVVWFGDFNYRIVETVSTEKCFELAEGGEADLEQLRVRDQLNIERAAQRSFHGFQEGPLTFRPTYKFQPGTSLYEQRPDKKLRAPAWCDRILWRSSPDVDPKSFRQLYYGSVDSMMTSDHKPVHALFEVAAKTVLQPKKDAVVREITRQLDAMENRAMPKVRT